MASRRDKVRDAVIVALGELELAGGVQPLARPQNDFATLPTVIVGQLAEDKRPGTTSTYECSLELAIDVFPEQVAGEVAAGFDDLVELVERALLAQNQLDPVLGVPGCLEVVLGGNEPFALDTEQLIGAALQVVVRYRHDVDDPAKYGGSTA